MNSKKITRIILLVALVALTVVLVSIVPVNAVVYNAAFDSDYYMNRYPDIKVAFEGDPDGAFNHFVTTGLNEGRVGSENFDAKFYLARYSDVNKAFNGSKVKAYNHYISQGIKEGRIASMSKALEEFDAAHYLAKYSDLQAAFGDDLEAARNHYVNQGYKEGRRATKADHVFVEQKVLEEATCYNEGRVAMVCKACNEGKIGTLPRVEHTYVQHTQKSATCKEDGKIVWTCSVPGCNVEDSIYEEVVPASSVEHTYTNRVVGSKVATCVEEGYTLQVCDVCGNIETVIAEKIAHTKTNVTTKAATCTKNGETAYDCTACHQHYTEVIPATGHAEGVVDVEASKASTCLEQGKTVTICPTCEEVLSEEVLPLGDHDWTDLTVNVTADCVKGVTGEKSQICTVCGKTEMTTYAGHDYSIIVKATCEKDGSKTCSKCGDKIIIPAKGHDWKQTVAPSCTTDGTETCQNVASNEYVACSATRDIKALGHDFEITTPATCTKNGVKTCKRENCDSKVGETAYTETITGAHNWVVTREATCTIAGVQKCSNCNMVETIPATGHSYSTTIITEPKCTTTGLGARHCPKCGETEASWVIPATGHTLGEINPAVEATCTTDGNIAYYTCSDCDKVIAQDTTTILGDVADVATLTKVEKLGHNYEVKFTWGDSNAKTATAKAVCKNDATHEDVISASVTVTTAYEGTNNVRYTATVVYNGQTYSATKLVAKTDVPVAALPQGN